MKITRIAIRNYRGIEAREASVGETGALISGKNGGGKTSFLKAVKAALAAQDIGPDAIRLGADKAEILVDLDDVKVRRAISAKTSSVTVTNRDGFRAPKPQAFLSDLLGTAALDPLDLFLARPKERRAQVLAALPVTVTLAQLRQWVPGLPDTFDCSGHGLEVVERVRKIAYDKRADANVAAKKAREDADRATLEVASLVAKVPEGAPSIDDARLALDRAVAEEQRLRTHADEASRGQERSARTRAKIEELRADAAAIRSGIDAPDECESPIAWEAWQITLRRVDALEAELAIARKACDEARTLLDAITKREKQAKELIAKAESIDASAAALESALADVAIDPIDPAAIEHAASLVTKAREDVAAASTALEAKQAKDHAAALDDGALKAETEAARLNVIVRALTNEAPAALLADAKSIPGLSLEGDEILLDGVRLDGLSGAEQMKFAVEIARRANARSKILLVDGLERLDPEQMEHFVAMATADGYQLIGTRVAKGEIVVEAIESSQEVEAAE